MRFFIVPDSLDVLLWSMIERKMAVVGTVLDGQARCLCRVQACPSALAGGRPADSSPAALLPQAGSMGATPR